MTQVRQHSGLGANLPLSFQRLATQTAICPTMSALRASESFDCQIRSLKAVGA
jgi:hypothetical protein